MASRLTCQVKGVSVTLGLKTQKQRAYSKHWLDGFVVCSSCRKIAVLHYAVVCMKMRTVMVVLFVCMLHYQVSYRCVEAITYTSFVIDLNSFNFYRSALNAADLVARKASVRPSVHLSVKRVNCVTKRKKNLSRFLYHTKDHLVF